MTSYLSFGTVTTMWLYNGYIMGGQGLAWALLLGAPLAAEPVAIPRLAQAPAIDGRLDEAAWQEAARLEGFVQSYPDPGAPATLATTVRIGFDGSAIYFGVTANDDPSRVRAALHSRDDLADDDLVAIYLDTFGERNRAYALRFNPLGVQQDGVFLEGSGTDLSVDLELRSVGRLTAGGYEVEIAVPLSSLRYPDRREQVFGLQIVRQSRHQGEESSWRPLAAAQAVRFPLERRVLLADCGAVRIADPLRGGFWLEATPTLSARAESERRPPTAGAAGITDPAGDWIDGSPRARGALALRGGRGRSLVVDLAYRPDFGEVEADPPVITANNPFPILFAERRPFFLEGFDLWRTLATTVDTRRIEQPESALKGTWQAERNAVAVLVADDASDERASDGLFRYRRSLGGESWAGALFTSRRTPERDNAVASIDGRFRLNARTTLAAQLSGSATDGLFYDSEADRTERRRGSGAGYALDLDHQIPELSLHVSALGFTPDYRADLGYVSRTDTHRVLAEARYSPPARSGARLVSWSFLQTVLLRTDSRGRTQYGYVFPHAELNFRGQSYLNLGLYLDYLKLVESDYGPRRSPGRAGAFSGAGERSTFYNGGSVTFGTTRRSWSAELTLDLTWNTLDYDFGAAPKFPRVSPAALADPDSPLDPGTGDTRTAAVSLRWQPSERWTASLSLSDDRLRRDDTGRLAYHATIASLRLERHFSKSAFARLRCDHDSLSSRTDTQFLFAFQPHLGTSLFLGYEDGRAYDGFNPWTGAPEPGWRPTRRTAFVKLSYALRRGD